MNGFLMHIGSRGALDVQYTITIRRSMDELIESLPADSPELEFFKSKELLEAFPDGTFNCWGIPNGAEKRFDETQVGDLVLFAPTIGLHGGGIKQLGIVKAKCPVRCLEASKILWPDTPYDKLYPFVFFFDSEIGFREWFGFLEDVKMKANWNPRGNYRKIRTDRFDPFGGTMGYLKYLRRDHDFIKIAFKYPTGDEGSPLMAEEPFNPDFSDSREFSIQAIKARRGQQAFRDELRKRYGDLCLVSGCKIIDIVEAAHIKPHRNIEDNHVQNGLLLRADIHTLFDLNLIAINPKNFLVKISQKLVDSEYQQYDNVPLKIEGKRKPSIEALRYKWNQFNEAER